MKSKYDLKKKVLKIVKKLKICKRIMLHVPEWVYQLRGVKTIFMIAYINHKTNFASFMAINVFNLPELVLFKLFKIYLAISYYQHPVYKCDSSDNRAEDLKLKGPGFNP